jgi:hypothetical protein
MFILSVSFWASRGFWFDIYIYGYKNHYEVCYTCTIQPVPVPSIGVLLRSNINLNIDDTPITSRPHTHPSHSQTSLHLTSSVSLGVPVPHTTHYFFVWWCGPCGVLKIWIGDSELSESQTELPEIPNSSDLVRTSRWNDNRTGCVVIIRSNTGVM